MEFLINKDSETVTVTIKGEFDANSVPTIRSDLDAIVEAKPRLVVVDLSSLKLIDSTGVGGIVSLFKRTRAYGGDFKVTGVQGQPQSIFKVLRLDRVFETDA